MIQSQLVSDTGDGQDLPEASEGKGSHAGRSPSPVLSPGRRLEDTHPVSENHAVV